MQTQETQNASSQSCLVASKRSRHSNNTERNQYGMQILTYISLVLTIFSLVMFAVLHSRKSKLCRGCMFCYCSEDHDIYFECTILCNYEIM